MIKNNIYLPDSMENDRNALEKTLRQIISMTITRENDVKGISVLKSKFGGNPYFPKRMNYPTNKNGKPLYMLAQINLNDIFSNNKISSEVEKDEYLKYLPKTGILSFFVDYHDDLIGYNVDGEQTQGYKVIYFKEIEEDIITDFKFLEQQTDSFYPVVDGEYSITFDILDQMVTMESIDWERTMNEDAYDYLQQFSEDLAEKTYEEYESAYAGGHQIGGYPYFTQDDPRYFDGLDKYNFLLLQLDSDYENKNNIMWGDSGVGQFFINIENLKKQDFNDVLYTWDCF